VSCILSKMSEIVRRWVPRLRPTGQIWRDEQGVAAIEFALIAGVFVILLLNGVDLGRYIYLREQVENAAQAGAHAVWMTCDPRYLPVTTKCPGWEAAATSAIFRTLLNKDTDAANDGVTLQKPITEGYFCPDTAGTLVAVTNPQNPPASCMTGVTPGMYVQLQVTYTYAPLFGDLSVSHLFGTSISKTSYMRLL
jgi:Flp pilus assembly pilin Flp